MRELLENWTFTQNFRSSRRCRLTLLVNFGVEVVALVALGLALLGTAEEGGDRDLEQGRRDV